MPAFYSMQFMFLARQVFTYFLSHRYFSFALRFSNIERSVEDQQSKVIRAENFRSRHLEDHRTSG